MEPVNKVHRFLELFLKRHGGYKREELQGWLNLFAFWYNTPETAMEKAIKLIEMAVKKRRMLRYRAWGSKKKHDGADIGIPHVQIRVFPFAQKTAKSCTAFFVNFGC